MWRITNENDFKYKDLNNFISLSYLNLNEYRHIYSKDWKNIQLIYELDKKIISLCNIYVIDKKILKIIYVPGGIEGEISKEIISDLKNYIFNKFKIFYLIFINFHNQIDLKKVIPKSFFKIRNLHESRMVMKKDINLIDNLNKTYSKNWRHNFNRSHNRNYKIESNLNPNIDDLLKVYREMEKIKNYKIYISPFYLKLIFKYMKTKIIHYEARINNRLIAFRTCIYHGDFAWDLLASSNLESKKNYCTYQIMHKIFEDLIKKKVKVFDFSGVDKKNNIGVYNFKKGTGSYEFLKIGEYVYSPIYILKIFFILFIFLKRIFKK